MIEETEDKRSMNLVNLFTDGLKEPDEKLINAFKLTGLGCRKKYEIAENKNLTTAMEK